MVFPDISRPLSAVSGPWGCHPADVQHLKWSLRSCCNAPCGRSQSLGLFLPWRAGGCFHKFSQSNYKGSGSLRLHLSKMFTRSHRTPSKTGSWGKGALLDHLGRKVCRAQPAKMEALHEVPKMTDELQKRGKNLELLLQLLALMNFTSALGAFTGNSSKLCLRFCGRLCGQIPCWSNGARSEYDFNAYISSKRTWPRPVHFGAVGVPLVMSTLPKRSN